MYHAHTYTIHIPYIYTYTICWPRLPRADTPGGILCTRSSGGWNMIRICCSRAMHTHMPHARRTCIYTSPIHMVHGLCVDGTAQAMREAVRAAERRAAAAEALLGQAPVRHSYTIETHV